MSDIGIRTVRNMLNEDQRWIAPEGIADMHVARTVSLNVALFSRVTFANNLIPSGVVLGKVTATGLYGPYDDTSGTGLQTALGFLLTTVEWDALKTSGNIVVPLYWRGAVIESLLPTGHGLDAAGKVDLASKFAIL
jgi:hypothetical protein